jgi:hypothetical protein
MARAIFCTVKNVTQASNVVDRLKSVGFGANEISVLLPDSQHSKDFAVDNQTKTPEGAAIGASTGAAVGGALGWLAGIGSLAIPGVGPLIAAGPIMAALTGAALGGAVGGVSGALVGMGIPEYEATRYEGKLKGGRCLISVHAENSDEISRAKKIMEDAGAEDISSSSEPSVNSASNW